MGNGAARRLAAVIEQAPVAIHVFAPDGTSLQANRAWAATWRGETGGNLFADPRAQAAGLVPFLREAAAGTHVSTPPLRLDADQGDGASAPRWLRGTLAPVVDEAGAVREVVLVAEDVTDQLAYERQLRHHALHDPLTGLPNRALFLDRLGQALVRSHRAGPPAVIFLDLDRFKAVNDAFGHAAGDRLLAEVARRLERCLRAGDTAARVGGDEFAVLLERDATVAEAAATAERIAAALADPVLVGERPVVPAASAGVVLAGAGADPGGVLHDADTAMYAAKRAGGGRYALFAAMVGEGGVQPSAASEEPAGPGQTRRSGRASRPRGYKPAAPGTER